MYYLARERALNNGQRYHIAAILWRGRNPVRIGVNSAKTHPRFKRIYADGSVAACMHAEMNVLRFSRPGDQIEVLRWTKSSSKPTLAKPCNHCRDFIRNAGISQVTYTTQEGSWKTLALR